MNVSVKLLSLVKNLKLSQWIIILIIPTTTIINFDKHKWVHPDSVIQWDIKSYYAYLPATIIHEDIYLDFINKDYKKYSKQYWPSKSPTGKNLIITTNGMSYLYLPFFSIAHIVALNSDYEADGYSVPYAFALVFSSLFYLVLGLFYLRKIQVLFFDELTAAITILLVYFGTNLLFYTSYDAPMPHTYNFTLLIIFIWNTIKWHQKQTFKRSIIIGLLIGIITLIRPTNIIILVFLIFYNIKKIREIKDRILLFISKWYLVLLMIMMFFIVWTPQFLYWKAVAGKYLFFSYGSGASFFWDNPQIWNVLFSFRKGWYIYTPIMLIATIGIIFLFKKNKKVFLPVLIFFVCFVYTISSWWCWWFGGSFGMRSFVDIYGIMALPLGALLFSLFKTKSKTKRFIKYPLLVILLFLVLINFHLIKRFNKKSLHYWWMSKEALFHNFWNYKPTKGYWSMIPVPDYEKAHKGVYVAKNLMKRYFGKYPIKPQMIVDEIEKDIRSNHNLKSYEKTARKHKISVDSAITIKAWNIYELKYSLDKYIEPLEKEYKEKKK